MSLPIGSVRADAGCLATLARIRIRSFGRERTTDRFRRCLAPTRLRTCGVVWQQNTLELRFPLRDHLTDRLTSATMAAISCSGAILARMGAPPRILISATATQGSAIRTFTIGTGRCPRLARHRDPCDRTNNHEILHFVHPFAHQQRARRDRSHAPSADLGVRGPVGQLPDDVRHLLAIVARFTPKPDQLLLSCRTIENVGLGPESVRWLEDNECLLGLGDGFVLNVLIGYRTTSRAQPAVHLPVFGTFVSLA